MELHGVQNKSVIVDGNNIRIIRKAGIFTSRIDKAIPIKNINAVDVKKPGFARGYIQFVLSGGKHQSSTLSLTGGAFEAASDENSVLFDGEENYHIAIKIKEYVENFMDNQQVVQQSSIADEISKLKLLLDQGAISQHEFDHMKRKLLGF